MDIDYNIDFYLHTFYSKQNIIKILESGKKLGFLYWGGHTYDQNINTDLATEILYVPTRKNKDHRSNHYGI